MVYLQLASSVSLSVSLSYVMKFACTTEDTEYAARPDQLNHMCLAEFAANYITCSGQELPEDETSDVLPTPEDGRSGRCGSIKLKNNLGRMYKCRREAIIHFHRFNLLAKCTGPR